MSKQKEFCLAALQIFDECNPELRKNLSDSIYLFNNRCRVESGQVVLNEDYHIENNVYGKNIFLHAVVGENGSGKSSLIEMIYRIANNFACVSQKGLPLESAFKISGFIKNLIVDLYYIIDGVLYSLSCKKDGVYITKDGKILYALMLNQYYEKGQFEQYWANLAEIAKYFFFTISTNFSMQSLISSDFKNEKSIRVRNANGLLFNLGIEHSGENCLGEPWKKKFFTKMTDM